MEKQTDVSFQDLTDLTRKKPYVPAKPGLKEGATGDEVKRLQAYLARFGYVTSPAAKMFALSEDGRGPVPSSGTFDGATVEAVKLFQRHNGLGETGALDEDTHALMSRPRCGFPDLADFVVDGRKWDHTNLTYKFLNFCQELTQPQCRNALRQAFDLWAAVAPLSFTEVAAGAAADIVIRFVAGDHGDGSGFDGASGILAHAFFPPPNSGALAGDMHFDEAETWSINVPATGIDLTTVAAHELGHALGLAHSNVSGALMFAFYGGPHRKVEPDDVAGIQSIYGAISRQENWRWCSKCEGLHFGGNGPGRCPAGGGHIVAGSGNYALAHNSPAAPGQANWRWCSKCEGLHFGGNGPGVCPAGGGHIVGGSGNYTLAHNAPAPGQTNWRWCSKCEGLHFGGNGPGRCPAGGGHIVTGSGNYTLLHL